MMYPIYRHSGYFPVGPWYIFMGGGKKIVMPRLTLLTGQSLSMTIFHYHLGDWRSRIGKATTMFFSTRCIQELIQKWVQEIEHSINLVIQGSCIPVPNRTPLRIEIGEQENLQHQLVNEDVPMSIA